MSLDLPPSPLLWKIMIYLPTYLFHYFNGSFQNEKAMKVSKMDMADCPYGR